MLKRYRIRDYDFKLILMLIAITAIGVFSVGSARADLQGRQLLGFIMGFFIMIVLSFFDYSRGGKQCKALAGYRRHTVSAFGGYENHADFGDFAVYSKTQGENQLHSKYYYDACNCGGSRIFGL